MANPPSPQSSPIIELRQYALHPGQRAVLIDLFEREFIESQEALGMRVLGTFRDLDRPDRFVWIRGFPDMASRGEGLDAFYSGFPSADRPRPPQGSTVIPRGLLIANVDSFASPVTAEFVDFFERTVKPELQAAGVMVCASYVSETSPNNFPRLPVRENEHVFVWFSSFADATHYERCLARLNPSPAWRAIDAARRAGLKSAPEVLRLQPTPRSAMPAAGGQTREMRPGGERS